MVPYEMAYLTTQSPPEGLALRVTKLIERGDRLQVLAGVESVDEVDAIVGILTKESGPACLRDARGGRWFVQLFGDVEPPTSYPDEVSIGLVIVEAPGPVII